MSISTILLKTKVGGDRVEDSLSIADSISDYANKKDFRVIRSLSEVTDPASTVIIPIGGDGTVLSAAKDILHLNIPIIGVNIGNLGFLTDLSPTQTNETLNVFFDGLKNINSMIRDTRTLLSVVIDDVEYTALNDIVVSNVYADSIIEYDLTVGLSNAGRHKANSVIISTPTGSTAYAMFAGGAIIEPGLDVIEIIPVAAMSMTSRPMIVGGNNHITVRIRGKSGREIAVKADGQLISRVLIESISDHIDIDIIRLEKTITLLHSSNWNFFDVLNKKLHWNAS